jgi:hypothetical protein
LVETLSKSIPTFSKESLKLGKAAQTPMDPVRVNGFAIIVF